MRILFSLLMVLFFAGSAWANNVEVSNIVLDATQVNKSAHTIPIKFDLSQDNAFGDLTDANSQAFSDYIWIFVKYYAGTSYDGTGYRHAKLQQTGSDAAFTVTSDGAGAFIKASEAKAGLTLVWDYGHNVDNSDNTSYVTTASTVNLKIFAIEMVKIPAGSFYVGDGTAIADGTPSHFFDASSAAGAAVQIGSTAPYISHLADGSGTAGDIAWVAGSYSGVLPASRTQIGASFPTGYNSFYIMKYEVTQGQYRDFLNSLTRAQQVDRVSSIVADYYALANTTTAANIGDAANYRNGIRLPATVPESGPITFGCDYDHDQIYNEASDGEWLACNYLSWPDLCAYAAWAGLRPLTELEFEKAARGGSPTNNVAAGEYAWGTTNLTHADTLANSGANNEGVTQTGNGLCNYGTGSDVLTGPLRSGFAATASTTRQQSGASYYGVMELSGNVRDDTVCVMGSQSGTSLSTFTATHGTGSLSQDGYATNSDWPGYSSGRVTLAEGSGVRGGDWSGGSNRVQVSDRFYAGYPDTGRYQFCGGRLARTAS